MKTEGLHHNEYYRTLEMIRYSDILLIYVGAESSFLSRGKLGCNVPAGGESFLTPASKVIGGRMPESLTTAAKRFRL